MFYPTPTLRWNRAAIDSELECRVLIQNVEHRVFDCRVDSALCIYANPPVSWATHRIFRPANGRRVCVRLYESGRNDVLTTDALEGWYWLGRYLDPPPYSPAHLEMQRTIDDELRARELAGAADAARTCWTSGTVYCMKPSLRGECGPKVLDFVGSLNAYLEPRQHPRKPGT